MAQSAKFKVNFKIDCLVTNYPGEIFNDQVPEEKRSSIKSLHLIIKSSIDKNKELGRIS